MGKLTKIENKPYNKVGYGVFDPVKRFEEKCRNTGLYT